MEKRGPISVQREDIDGTRFQTVSFRFRITDRSKGKDTIRERTEYRINGNKVKPLVWEKARDAAIVRHNSKVGK